MTTEKEKKENLIPRPPIVVVMGHIDHGKTTLLDYIRKAGIAGKESGGITQHIGAYQAELQTKDHQLRNITFLDTPGHEAFSKMRSRGARVADIAVLVVAADDGVKPQTKEALSAIVDAKVPYVVAINKIDRPSANEEKVVRELMEADVLLEGRGGNVPWVSVSAKEGSGVDQLLETIMLLAELEEIKADFQSPAQGVVIESHLDSKRGIAATLLVRDGSFKTGDFIVAGSSLAKVRIAENFKGEAVKLVLPSMPAVVVGFDELPEVGSRFQAFTEKIEAMNWKSKARVIPAMSKPQEESSGAEEKTTMGVVIKADTLGSAEAVEHEIKKLENEKLNIKVIRSQAGGVTEDDVKMASSAENPMLIAFRTAIKPEVRESALKFGVTAVKFEIIYEIVDFLSEHLKTIIPQETEVSLLGKAKIVKVFSQKGKNQIIGGKVLEGILKKNSKVNILRRENKIGEARIENLQTGKANADKAESPGEFGAATESTVTIAPGDILESVVKK